MTNIKELRKHSGYSQQQLADILGVDQTSVSGWENGRYLPNTDKVVAMAKLFNVSTDYVIGFSRFHNPSNMGNDNYLNFEEFEIIEDYRSLSPDLQKVIKQTLKTFKGSN